MSRTRLADHLQFAAIPAHPDFTLSARTLSASGDYGDAVAYFVNGVEDDPRCQNNLALFFALGIHYPTDIARSQALLNAAAAADLPQAHYNLGLLEHYGAIPRQGRDPGNFSRALSLGIKEASYYLGLSEEHNISERDRSGNAIDRSEALGDARIRAMRFHAVAAEANYPPALTRLGDLCRHEVEVRDEALALSYYSRAAEQDHLPATIAAAELYLSGYAPRLGGHSAAGAAFFINPAWEPARIAALQETIRAQTRDVDTAIRLLWRATRQHKAPAAYEMLGDIFKDVKNDYREAASWYLSGSQKGSLACLAKCGEMFLLCEAIRHKGMAKEMFTEFKRQQAASREWSGKLLALREMADRYLEEIKPPSRKKRGGTAETSGQSAD